MEVVDFFIENMTSVYGVVLILLGVYMIRTGNKAHNTALKMMAEATKRERVSIDRLFEAKDLVRKADAKMDRFTKQINENIPNVEIVMVPMGENPIEFMRKHMKADMEHPLEMCRDMDYDYFMDNCVENWTLEDINHVIPEFEKLGMKDKADILRAHIAKKQ